MKFVGEHYEHKNKHYPQIGLYNLIKKHFEENTEFSEFKLSDTVPKLEKENSVTESAIDEKYEYIKYTNQKVCELIMTETMTMENLCNELKNLITNKCLDFHEVMCALISFSLWECIEYLLQLFPIEKISKNNHNFNSLHKSLLTSWLWNYNKKLINIPKNLSRTQNDILKTIQILIKCDLVESMLEPTPREIFNSISQQKEKKETSLCLLMKTIPNNVLNPDIKYQIYDCMTSNLSKERIRTELTYIIDSMGKMADIMIHNHKRDLVYYKNIIKEEFGNSIKCILTQSTIKLGDIVEIMVDILINKNIKKSKHIFIDNLVNLLEIISTPLINNDPLEHYFEKKEINKEHIKNIMIGIKNKINSKKELLDEKTFNMCDVTIDKYIGTCNTQ